MLRKKYFLYISVLLGYLVLNNLANAASPPAPIDGVCNPINEANITVAPTTGLCLSGTASAVTSAGASEAPWKWSCTGSNGGTTASCAANFVYSEIIPTSSGLSYDASTDTQQSFTAPNGRTVDVLVKGPQGISNATTWHAPIIGSPGVPNTPDNYFPWIVNYAVNKGYHRIAVPPGVYYFSGSAMSPTSTICSAANPSQCSADWAIGPQWWLNQSWQGPQPCPNNEMFCYPLGYPLEDLEIDFDGSKLIFNGPTIGIAIGFVNRIRLKNFTVDYPWLQVAVLGTIIPDPKAPGHQALAIDPQYPVTAMNADFLTASATGNYPQVQVVNTWVPGTTGSPDLGHFAYAAGNNNAADEVYFVFGANPPTYIGQQSVTSTTTDGVTTTTSYPQVYSCFPTAYGKAGAQNCGVVASTNSSDCSFYNGCANFDYFPLGAQVVVRYLTVISGAISIISSNDVDIENMTMLSSPGNGISISNNGGYRGFRLANSTITRSGNRPISVTGAALLFGQMQGDVIIENNEIAYQGDDAIDLHGTPQPFGSGPVVKNIDTANKEVTILIPPTHCSDLNMGDQPLVGDKVAFFDQNTVYIDTAEVAAMNAPCQMSNGSTSPWTITLENCTSGDCTKTVGKLTSIDYYSDLTKEAAARYVIAGNKNYANRGHGLLISAPYGLVSNNTFIYNTLGNLAFDDIGEGFGSSNLVIDYNNMQWSGLQNPAIQAIDNQSGTNIASAVFQKIMISHNTISNTYGSAIGIGSARDVFLENNEISNSNLYPNLTSYSGLPSTDSIVFFGMTDSYVCGTTLSDKHGSIENLAGITDQTNCLSTTAGRTPE